MTTTVRRPDGLLEVTLKNGQKRYRFVVDVGSDAASGKRRQLTVTRNTLKEAKAERSRIQHQTETGELIPPNKITVSEWLDRWYESKKGNVEETTLCSYAIQLVTLKRYFGVMPLQKVTEDHVEAFIVWMLTEGRSRCGKPGTGLRPSTADVLLARFKDACRFAVRRRVLTRSPAEYASIPRMARRQDRAENPRTPWNVNEVQVFLVGIRQERLFACVLLSLMGMRPAEVAGLRWADIDLDRGTLSIANTRTSVGDVQFEKATKTEAGTRVLPLPAPVIVALLALKVTQEAEGLALGADYLNQGGYVLVDEAGLSLNTADYRRAAYALMAMVGLRKVRLYDARASCLTFLAVNGVPDVILAAWAGHTNASFTKRFYVHPDPEDLRGAAVQLERLLELPSVSS